MIKKTKLPSIEVVGPIVLMLTLDKEAKTERVVIGEKTSVRFYLEGNSDYEVLYDQKRPLGQLIFDYESQERGDWNAEVIFPLVKALRFEDESGIWEKQAVSFLEANLNSDNAVSVFTSYLAMLYYAAEQEFALENCRGVAFERKMLTQVRSYEKHLLCGNEPGVVEGLMKDTLRRLHQRMCREETDLEIWYPWRRCNLECAVTEGTMLPLLIYYLHRLEDWGYIFRNCEVCGELFLALSGHYSMCSDVCRAIQKRRNEQAHGERARKNRYDKEYQRSTQYMRRCLNRYRKRENTTDEQYAEAEYVYDRIRTEAKQRKKTIKTEEDIIQFRAWLLEQERIIADLCGGK